MELFDDNSAAVGVEIACRLIGKNQTRLVKQSACDYNPLLFASAQLMRHFIAFFKHGCVAQYFVGAAVGFSAILPACCV